MWSKNLGFKGLSRKKLVCIRFTNTRLQWPQELQRKSWMNRLQKIQYLHDYTGSRTTMMKAHLKVKNK